MTDHQVRDEVSGFFIAGHETVSSALTWTWYLLSKNPDVLAAGQGRGGRGARQGRVPTAEDVPSLEYTTPRPARGAAAVPPDLRADALRGRRRRIGELPRAGGSNIVLCPYVTHRHPDFWDNPDGFDPDRFLPERSAGRHRLAYFPFAGGPRKCIGDSFAMMQMPIVVAMIAQRWRLDLVPGTPVVAQPAISTRPKDPLWMTLTPVDVPAAAGRTSS